MRTAIAAAMLALLTAGAARAVNLIAPPDLHDGLAVAAPAAVGLDGAILAS